jgi:hypothetical protein
MVRLKLSIRDNAFLLRKKTCPSNATISRHMRSALTSALFGTLVIVTKSSVLHDFAQICIIGSIRTVLTLTPRSRSVYELRS